MLSKYIHKKSFGQTAKAFPETDNNLKITAGYYFVLPGSPSVLCAVAREPGMLT
jgi:hypothetical protein